MASTSSSKSEPPADHHEEEKAKKFPSQTRYIAFVVLVIIVVMSVAMGIIWAVVQPKRPSVVVQNGYFIDGTRNISHADMSLSGSLFFEINITNPNKKATIYFDTLNASTSFSDQTERVGSLNKGFVLLPAYWIPINYSFRAEFRSMFGYMPKYQKQGRIIVDITFEAKIRFGFAKWKSQPRTIHFYCSHLRVFYGKSFKPTVCEIDY